MSTGGFSARAARPHARHHGGPRRERPRARPRRPCQPARRDPCRCDRHDGLRRQRADAARHDLPHRLDDQADHGRGRHDPGRGMQAPPRRSGRSSSARAGRPQGAAHHRQPARRHRAGEARDHAARPADVSPGLRRRDGVPAALPDPEGDGGGGHRARPGSAGDPARRADEALRQPAAGASAGRAVAVQHRLGHPGRADRARVRQDARRVPARAASSRRSA